MTQDQDTVRSSSVLSIILAALGSALVGTIGSGIAAYVVIREDIARLTAQMQIERDTDAKHEQQLAAAITAFREDLRLLRADLTSEIRRTR